MKFSLFIYCTVGRRAELEGGMAGRKPELYQRMLDEIAERSEERRVGKECRSRWSPYH